MARLPDYPKNRSVYDLISQIKRPDPYTDTSWYKAGPSEPHGVNFATSTIHNVTSSTGAVNPVSWYFNSDGEVKLRGRFTGAEAGQHIITLPPELRPEYDMHFPVDSDVTGEYVLDAIRFRSYQEGDIDIT